MTYLNHINTGIPVIFFISFMFNSVIIKLRSVGPRGQERSQSKRKSHRKVTKLVLTVITVYIICWLPHWATQIALIRCWTIFFIRNSNIFLENIFYVETSKFIGKQFIKPLTSENFK